jgi:hypothetical protein
LAALVLLCLPGFGQEEQLPWLLPTAEQIDFDACRALVDDKPVSGNFKDKILRSLGLGGGEPWAVGRREEGQNRTYLIAFRQPLAVGSVLFQHGGTLKYLKAEAEGAPDPAKAETWEEVKFLPGQSGWRLATLPPGTKTRAVLCRFDSAWWYEWHRLEFLRLLAPRLHNIVPDALANGEAEYISYADLRPPIYFTAANITRGSGSWQSHGPDGQGRNFRPPVTDIDPTWFVVSWDEPQTVIGLFVRSNFRKLKLLSYRGPAGLNPAVASGEHWKRVKHESYGDSGARWLVFAPIQTRGLKFHVEDAQGRYGELEGLQAFVDLQDAPAPVRTAVAKADPVFRIPFSLPGDGTVSMAIDGPGGCRVRNLIAREDRKVGAYEQGWDLKDEVGCFVEPGAYRWTVLWHPGLRLSYEMTPYPNVEMNAPENSAWLNGASGPGGWLADHSTLSGACAVGERVFLSAPCAESGVALIECDLQGRKLWGHHNIAAWTGPSFLATDGHALYAAPWSDAGGTDSVWRFKLPEKQLDTVMQSGATAIRRRGIRGMAARDDRLYLSINAGVFWLENAASAGDVDMDRCEPKYPRPKGGGRPDDADYPQDFLRLFRLMGTPPGCNGFHYLETAKSPEPRHHIVLAFNKPVPLGSFAFPLPEEETLHLRVSILKPEGAYPPVSGKESDWNLVWKGLGKGWTVLPAPENTMTRAVRLSFDHGLSELDEIDVAGEAGEKLDASEGSDSTEDAKAWKARLEGMKLLRRRFTNLFSKCRVRVNSGTVTPEGEWDAQREKPLTKADPGIYLMEWDEPQSVRGLAIKEIDGRFTEIDAWNGEGTPELAGDKGWERLTTYEQPLRYYYQPDQYHNSSARYIDGYVDFGREVRTKALRLRVVEQWMWKEDDRAGCVGVRRDRGGDSLEPARCRIYGVAPLQYLGGEPPVDSLVSERLEVHDLQARKLVKEVPLAGGEDLAFAPNGDLYAIAAGKVWKLDTENGKHSAISLDVKQPRALAFDRHGNLFVFDQGEGERVAKVFDPSGKLVRKVGTPGGRIVGPHDPTRFGWVGDLAVDAQDQLWVVENDYYPKRITLWGADGRFIREFLGNTGYGGGGCLNPYDKSGLFYGPLEFELDWQAGKSRLKNITWMGDSPAGEVPIKVDGRLYLVTRPIFLGQSVGIVYLHEKDRLRRVAAVGSAGRFGPLRSSEILQKLGRKAIGYFEFAWSDKNGDGVPQPEEVQFFENRHSRGLGRFDHTLSIDAGSHRFEVTGFLPNGAPVYERRKKPFDDGAIKTFSGQFFVVGNDHQMAGLGQDGKAVWTHPTEGWGVHALYYARPWWPGQTVAQFGVIGHETAHAGDLGEFFVTHSNSGIWHVWTADGFLAGRIFRDMRGPGGRPWSMREHDRGLDLTDLTAGQEHFNGYFCRTEDNRYYIVAGHNHVSVVEVQGIEQFRRLGGEVKVTPQDIQAAIGWDRKRQARKLYEAAKLITCRRAAKEIRADGDGSDWGKDDREYENARLPGRDVSFGMAYDDNNLYLCFGARDCGPMRNTGNDWKRLFKTGAAVDLQIGTDPAAPPDRTAPVEGDIRLLMTFMDGKPTAVLYQPACPGARPDEAWETHTMVFKSSFDRVALVPEVRLAGREQRNDKGEVSYFLEVSVPLKSLGLTIKPDLTLKMDWGILVSGPDGTEVLQRLYWANPQTSIVSDEAAEATLHPDLWGMVRFLARSRKDEVPDLDLGKAGGSEKSSDLDPDKGKEPGGGSEEEEFEEGN